MAKYKVQITFKPIDVSVEAISEAQAEILAAEMCFFDLRSADVLSVKAEIDE